MTTKNKGGNQKSPGMGQNDRDNTDKRGNRQPGAGNMGGPGQGNQGGQRGGEKIGTGGSRNQ